MAVVGVYELDVLRRLARRPCHHSLIPLPQRLRMGPLMAAGLVRLEKPDFWSITEEGEAILAAQGIKH